MVEELDQEDLQSALNETSLDELDEPYEYIPSSQQASYIISLKDLGKVSEQFKPNLGIPSTIAVQITFEMHLF
jgi:hypothetical protein